MAVQYVPGHVYLFRSENGLYKIGSSEHVERRLSILRSSSPIAIDIVWAEWFDNALLVEKKFHKKFAAKKHHGEWFILNDEDIQFIKGVRNRNYGKVLPRLTPEGRPEYF